ncbi:hypothetical protein AT864_01916 [Anoxybacillus sp. P3H1B]|uniref:hypothetical protein n=1 Tax=Anoxybacillus sp. P3H1B TaxID=1769293 RepID=UPI00079AD6C9|nr:hypothetical protein [Anoxybacillus sp. P3H1B]KXG09747.1 hypothetical protein AT864_01916 [Anoxybacillus sp. P3H1B]
MLSVEFAKIFSKQQGGAHYFVDIRTIFRQSLGPMSGETAYAATKGALDAFVKTFVVEVTEKGITQGPNDLGGMNEELKQHLLLNFPFGRIGTPRDAARLIRFFGE